MSITVTGIVLRILGAISLASLLLLWMTFHDVISGDFLKPVDRSLIPFLLCALPLLVIGIIMQTLRRRSMSSAALVIDLLLAVLPLGMAAVLLSWFQNHV
jgi:hypothetical protein